MWKSLAATATLAVSLTSPNYVVAQEAPASPKSQSEQTVDAMNGVFGVHVGVVDSIRIHVGVTAGHDFAAEMIGLTAS